MAAIERSNVIEGATGDTLTTAGAPVDGVAGSFFGRAPIGRQLVDTVSGILYVNTGTQASPVWTKVGLQS